MNFAQQLATDLSNAVKANKPARKAPAKATSKPAAAPAKPAKAKASKPTAAPVLALGKPFTPKAGGKYAQAENWAVILPLLPATKDDLIAAVRAAGEKGDYADRCNAAGFVQGRIRDGHLL